MRKSIIICLVLFSLFSLAGCSTSDLEELRYEKEIENKKVEAVVSEYNTNILLFQFIEKEIMQYLFEDNVDMNSFKNADEVFYNKEQLYSIYFARERMFSYIKKYDLSAETIKEYARYYPFMDDKTGGVEVFYRIPIEDYAELNMTLNIQEGQIISVVYEVEKK